MKTLLVAMAFMVMTNFNGGVGNTTLREEVVYNDNEVLCETPLDTAEQISFREQRKLIKLMDEIVKFNDEDESDYVYIIKLGHLTERKDAVYCEFWTNDCRYNGFLPLGVETISEYIVWYIKKISRVEEG